MSLRTSYKPLLFCALLCAVFASVFFIRTQNLQADDEITWGVDFSDSQAEYLGLDPDETYSAVIHDLGAKHIKIHINWNATEATRGHYDFASLDRHVRKAELHNVKLILVVGMKTGRWPECHTPTWVHSLSPEERDEEILRYVGTVVDRYKDSDAVRYWQVENEPLVQFGTCPSWYYENTTDLLKKEVALVKERDPKRKVILSDSGELSSWTEVASIADIVGITMYRSSWDEDTKTFGVNRYAFLAPEYYAAKAAFIEHFYEKPVISVELQAEPWVSNGLAEASLKEQAQSMNPELFAENISFAKKAGLDTYYLWGVEWWYYMKETHDRPAIWNEAKLVFSE